MSDMSPVIRAESCALEGDEKVVGIGRHSRAF